MTAATASAWWPQRPGVRQVRAGSGSHGPRLLHAGRPQERALYYARIDGGHISRQRDHLISPNGVGLSPDEAVVYLADTQLGRLWAFDIESPGHLRPRPVSAPAAWSATCPATSLAGQPGRRGFRQGLRGDHHQRRDHRFRPPPGRPSTTLFPTSS